MTNKSLNETSNLEATEDVHLLKDQITGIEDSLKHLHAALGSHINALDKEFVKGEKVKPVKTQARLLKAAASPLSAGGIFSDFIRSLGRIDSAGNQSDGSADMSLGGGSYGLSQGQTWSRIAAAVASASKRYL